METSSQLTKTFWLDINDFTTIITGTETMQGSLIFASLLFVYFIL